MRTSSIWKGSVLAVAGRQPVGRCPPAENAARDREPESVGARSASADEAVQSFELCAGRDRRRALLHRRVKTQFWPMSPKPSVPLRAITRPPSGDLIVSAQVALGRMHPLPVLAELLAAFPEVDARRQLQGWTRQSSRRARRSRPSHRSRRPTAASSRCGSEKSVALRI